MYPDSYVVRQQVLFSKEVLDNVDNACMYISLFVSNPLIIVYPRLYVAILTIRDSN